MGGNKLFCFGALLNHEHRHSVCRSKCRRPLSCIKTNMQKDEKRKVVDWNNKKGAQQQTNQWWERVFQCKRRGAALNRSKPHWQLNPVISNCIAILRLSLRLIKFGEMNMHIQHPMFLHFCIADQIKWGNAQIQHCNADEMTSDYMSEGPQGFKFQKFHHQIMGFGGKEPK